MPILLQLLQDAADEHLPVCAPLPETSVVGQSKVEKTESLAASGAPSSAEPLASCQASSSTSMSDAPDVSQSVSTPLNAGQPKTTAAAQVKAEILCYC